MKRKYYLGLLCLLFVGSICLSACKFVKQPDIGDIVYEDVDSENPDTIITPSPTKEPSSSPTQSPTPTATKIPEATPSVTPEEDVVPPAVTLLPAVTPEITQNIVSIVVDTAEGDMDEEKIVEFFYGESRQQLFDDGYLQFQKWETYKDSGYKRFDCEKEGKNIRYTYGNDMSANSFVYKDYNYNASKHYEQLLLSDYMGNEFSKRMEEVFPEEDLESCTREEAIAICRPLAEACGYGDAKVNAYAMKKEVLNNFVEISRHGYEGAYSAPDPEYDHASAKIYIDEMAKKSDEARAAGNDELAREYNSKIIALYMADANNGVAWSSLTEAYLIVYRSVLNGRVLDSGYYQMICVYVPGYEKVVYAKAPQPFVAVETLEEVELISQEEAIQEMLRVLTLNSSEGIKITGVSLVYSPRSEQLKLKKQTINPCWRIDYEMDEKLLHELERFRDDDGTMLINAVDGRETKYYQY